MTSSKGRTVGAHLPLELVAKVEDEAQRNDRSVSYVLGKIITNHYRNLPEVRFSKKARRVVKAEKGALNNE